VVQTDFAEKKKKKEKNVFKKKKRQQKADVFLIHWKTVVIAKVFVPNEKLYWYIFHCCAPFGNCTGTFLMF
jgi:hypothetical protein